MGEEPGGGAQRGLLLYLSIDPGGTTAAVDLPLDATVADLKAAAHRVGGPRPRDQTLRYGGADLGSDETPLSETQVSSEALVVVSRVRLHRRCVSSSRTRTLVLLESGEVVTISAAGVEFSEVGSGVSSVHAAYGFSVAVADGELVVWDCGTLRHFKSGLAELRGRPVVSCSPDEAISAPLLAAVDCDGRLVLCGEDRVVCRYAIPPDLQGRAAAVSCGGVVAVLTHEGGVVIITPGAGSKEADLGGKRATSVSAAAGDCAVLLEDGTVRYFGHDAAFAALLERQRRKDVVGLELGPSSAVLLFSDGDVDLVNEVCGAPDDAGPGFCAAISRGPTGLCVVTPAGELRYYQQTVGCTGLTLRHFPALEQRKVAL